MCRMIVQCPAGKILPGIFVYESVGETVPEGDGDDMSLNDLDGINQPAEKFLQGPQIHDR